MFSSLSQMYRIVPSTKLKQAALHPCTLPCAAAPTTGHLAGTDTRSAPYIKYEFGGDERRGVSPSSSFREGASSEAAKATNNLLPRNRRPESWAPWEDVKLGAYKPIQVLCLLAKLRVCKDMV